jgi:hypothetical protein
MQYEKGHIGARWLAEDENGDDLVFKVEIRGTGESEWKLLAEDVADPYLSWDSTAFPDGEYVLRVTGTDAPDNPPHEALEAQLTGEPFLIDNSAPEIAGLEAARDGRRTIVRWKASDARTVIQRAEYSLDGGEWTLVQPVGRLSDSRDLAYELTLDETPEREHTVAVRVTDLFDNQAVRKVVLR